jgi:hypothetical protein
MQLLEHWWFSSTFQFTGKGNEHQGIYLVGLFYPPDLETTYTSSHILLERSPSLITREARKCVVAEHMAMS